MIRDDELQLPTWEEVEEVSKAMIALLEGRGPMLQGAVLADVVAMYFAGHHPAMREGAMEAWIETMQRLVKPNEDAFFEEHPRPPGWNRSN